MPKNIIPIALTAVTLSTPAWAASDSWLSPDQPRVTQAYLPAQQCSETALQRYALSSTESAEKIADAAFYRCNQLWQAYVKVSSRAAESPHMKEARKDCVKQNGGAACARNVYKEYSEVWDITRNSFISDASREVFEIRAKAKEGGN